MLTIEGRANLTALAYKGARHSGRPLYRTQPQPPSPNGSPRLSSTSHVERYSRSDSYDFRSQCIVSLCPTPFSSFLMFHSFAENMALISTAGERELMTHFDILDLTGASVALLTYDWLLSIDHDASFVWNMRLNATKVLYIGNRLLWLATTIFQVLIINPVGDEVCSP